MHLLNIITHCFCFSRSSTVYHSLLLQDRGLRQCHKWPAWRRLDTDVRLSLGGQARQTKRKFLGFCEEKPRSKLKTSGTVKFGQTLVKH